MSPFLPIKEKSELNNLSGKVELLLRQKRETENDNSAVSEVPATSIL